MTTLHITNAYHLTSGGIRNFYDALLEAGNRENRRVVLIVPGRTTETVDISPHGRIHFVRAPRVATADERRRLILPYRFLPGLSCDLVEILVRERPAVVEICDKYSLPYLATMLRKGWHPRVGRPTLVGLTCERFDDESDAGGTRGAAGRAFTRQYIRHLYGPAFDAHIALSEYIAQELRAALYDRPSGFIRVARFGVDLERCANERRTADVRNRLLRRTGGDSTSVLLLYVGPLAVEKKRRAARRDASRAGADWPR
jgi:hypothetical protein